MVLWTKSIHHNLQFAVFPKQSVRYCIKAVLCCRLCGPAWSGHFLKRGTWLIVFAFRNERIIQDGLQYYNASKLRPDPLPPPFSWLYPTEKWGKVVAASWGTELLQFLAAPAIFPQDELKKRLICTLFLQLVPVKISLLFKSSQIK